MQVRIRAAKAADVTRARELTALAGVDLEDEIAQAVAGGMAGASLRVGRAQGPEAFLMDVHQQFMATVGSADPSMFLRLTLVLVAEGDNGSVLGAALTHPPIRIIQQAASNPTGLGLTRNQAMLLYFKGAVRIARLKAVGVDAAHRRRGVGAALVRTSHRAFAELGYPITYGQMPPTPGLDLFYGDLGFTVLPAGAGFNAKAAFEVGVGIHSDADEQIFLWVGSAD